MKALLHRFEGVGYGILVLYISIKDLVGDGNAIPVDQKTDFNLAAVRPMVTAVPPACNGAAVTLKIAGGEIVKYQREVKIENIVDVPENILLQGFLVRHEIVQDPVIMM